MYGHFDPRKVSKERTKSLYNCKHFDPHKVLQKDQNVYNCKHFDPRKVLRETAKCVQNLALL